MAMVTPPTTLWRLFKPAVRDRPPGGPAPKAQPPQHARAVILPGGPPHTLTFFVNDAMDRAENYDTIEVALFRADDVKRTLIEDGWKEEE
jgi:hypothetical protein